ncbi:hypothetical protein [Croceimicrobium sp.]|uniref:hypothetical protein n=1 Tax=Croceimicrobium sp. TaxID=2828340 RepID=UPI003BA9B7A1
MKLSSIKKYGLALLIFGLIAYQHGSQLHHIVHHKLQETAYLFLSYLEVHCN